MHVHLLSKRILQECSSLLAIDTCVIIIFSVKFFNVFLATLVFVCFVLMHFDSSFQFCYSCSYHFTLFYIQLIHVKLFSGIISQIWWICYFYIQLVIFKNVCWKSLFTYMNLVCGELKTCLYIKTHSTHLRIIINRYEKLFSSWMWRND